MRPVYDAYHENRDEITDLVRGGIVADMIIVIHPHAGADNSHRVELWTQEAYEQYLSEGNA
jgi:hypothetical protein